MQFACPIASVTDTSLALQDIAGFGWAALSSWSWFPMLSPGPPRIALRQLSASVKGLRDWQDRSRSLLSSLVSHHACWSVLSSLLLAPSLNYFLERSREGRQGGPWDLTKGCWRWEGTAVAWGLGSPQSPHWVDCLVGFLQEEKNGQFGEMRCLATLSPEGTAGTSMGLSETYFGSMRKSPGSCT